MNIDFRITGIRSCECLAAAHPRTPKNQGPTGPPADLRAVPGGADRDRTDDPLVANQVLSQLSYSPAFYLPAARSPGATATLVGLGRFELPTSRLSGVRSDQLSYRPSPGICRFPGN